MLQKDVDLDFPNRNTLQLVISPGGSKKISDFAEQFVAISDLARGLLKACAKPAWVGESRVVKTLTHMQLMNPASRAVG